MLHGYSANTKGDLLIGPGILMAGNVVLGVSRGSFTFDPGKQIRNIDFDGKSSPMAGLDRIVAYDAKLSGVLLEWNEATLEMLEHGAALGAAVSGVQLLAPRDANTLFTSDNIWYVDNLRFLMDLSDGTIASILFAKAAVESWSVKGAPGGEGELSVVFGARLAGTDPDPCPYALEIRTAVPA